MDDAVPERPRSVQGRRHAAQRDETPVIQSAGRLPTAARGRGRGRAAAAAAAAPPAAAPAAARQKRAREPSPRPGSEQDNDDERSSEDGSGSESSEGAGSDRDDEAGSDAVDSEAAALAAAVQASLAQAAAAAAAAAPPQPQLSVRQQAAALLLGMGVPRDRAEKALQEAAEEAEAEFGDAAAWAEEAQVKLACLHEFEAERDELAVAMDESLREEEARKRQQKPLHEREDGEILRDFADSAVLAALLARAPASNLLAPPLRRPLLDYLQLEKRCKHWWTIARHFFQSAAHELAAQLAGEGDGGAQQAAAPPATADGNAGAAGGSAAAAAAAAAGDVPAPLPLPDEAAAVLAAALAERRAAVEAAAFSMPAGVTVPQLFSDAVPQNVQLEVVSLTDSDEEEAGGVAAQQQQQQPAGAG